MADFSQIIPIIIKREGGYKFHRVKNDRGGLTYAGITQRWYPDWPGFSLSQDDSRLPVLARDFYRKEFWDKIQGDDIKDAGVALCLMSCAVLSHPKTSLSIAQEIVGVEADGFMGPDTLEHLDNLTRDSGLRQIFIMGFALRRIERFRQIVLKDKTQRDFFFGWINRVFADLEDVR